MGKIIKKIVTGLAMALFITSCVRGINNQDAYIDEMRWQARLSKLSDSQLQQLALAQMKAIQDKWRKELLKHRLSAKTA